MTLDDSYQYLNGILVPDDIAPDTEDFWSPFPMEEVKMNRALIVIALAVVTFFQGFLGTLIAGGLTDLDVTTLEAAAVGAAGGALSVIVNGIGKLHAYLAERAAL